MPYYTNTYLIIIYTLCIGVSSSKGVKRTHPEDAGPPNAKVLLLIHKFLMGLFLNLNTSSHFRGQNLNYHLALIQKTLCAVNLQIVYVPNVEGFREFHCVQSAVATNSTVNHVQRKQRCA